jgi:hypothetical protein
MTCAEMPVALIAEHNVLKQELYDFCNLLSGDSSNPLREGNRRLPLIRRNLQSADDNGVEGLAVDAVPWLFALMDIKPKTALCPALDICTETVRLETHWRRLSVKLDEYQQNVEAHSKLAKIVFNEATTDLALMNRWLSYLRQTVDTLRPAMSRLVDLLYFQRVCGGAIYDSQVPQLSQRRAVDDFNQALDSSLDATDPHRKARDPEVLFAYLLKELGKEHYRRRGNDIYKEKKVDFQGERHATLAWEKASFGSSRGEEEASSIDSFVLICCQKATCPDKWRLLVNSGLFKKAVEYLKICDEPEFPTLHPNRNLLAFSNGVYNTSAPHAGAFYLYGSKAMHELHGQVAAKYFDQEMPIHIFDIPDWWDIPTPIFQCAP